MSNPNLGFNIFAVDRASEKFRQLSRSMDRVADRARRLNGQQARVRVTTETVVAHRRIDRLARRLEAMGRRRFLLNIGVAVAPAAVPVIAALTAAAGGFAAAAAPAAAAAGAFGVAAQGLTTRVEESREALQDINEDLKQARQQLKEAQADVDEAQAPSPDAVRRVAEARKALAEASSGERSEELADLREAQRDLAESAKPTSDQLRRLAQAQQEVAQLEARRSEILKNFTPAVQEFIKAQDGLTQAWNRFLDNVQPEVLGALSQGMRTAASSLKLLEPLVQAGARGFEALQARLQQFSGSPMFQRFIDFLAAKAVPLIIDFGNIFVNSMKGVMGLVRAFLPTGQSFVDWLRRASARFSNWAQTLESSDSFQRFIRFARRSAPVVVDVLTSLGTALLEVAKALAPLGLQILKVIGRVANFTAETAKAHPQLIRFLGASVAVLAGLKAVAAPALTIIRIFGAFADIFKNARTAAKLLWGGLVRGTFLTIRLGFAARRAGRRVVGLAASLRSTAVPAVARAGRAAGQLAMIWGTRLAFAARRAGRRAAAFTTQLVLQRGATVASTVVAKGATLATRTWTVAQRALNLAMRLNPIGLVITAIAALVAGIVIAWRRSETFRKIVKGALNAVKNAALAVWRFFKGPFVNFFTSIPGFFRDLWNRATLIFRTARENIRVIAIDLALKVLKAMDKMMGWVPGLGGKISSAIEKFQKMRRGINSETGKLKNRDVKISSSVQGKKVNVKTGDTDVTMVGQGLGFFREGGQVRGRGGPKSDSRLIAASPGEFMQRAEAVSREGLAAMEALNKGWATIVPRFAAGGLVDFATAARKTPMPGRTTREVNTGTRVVQRKSSTELAGAVEGIFQTAIDNVLNSFVAAAPGIPRSARDNASVVRAVSRRRGWASGPQWQAMVKLLMSESGFRNTAANPRSTAYGIYQFLNSTWATVGGRKTSNPRLQAVFGNRYIAQRYGNPINAWAFKRANNWYGNGLQGGVFTRPTTIGVGERGPERVDVTPVGKRGGAQQRGGGQQPLVGSLTLTVPQGASARDVVEETVHALRVVRLGGKV